MGSSHWGLYFLAGLLLILTKQFSKFRGVAVVATVVNVALLEFIRVKFFTYNPKKPPLTGGSDGDALLAVYLILSWFVFMVVLWLVASVLRNPVLARFATVSLVFCLAIVLRYLVPGLP